MQHWVATFKADGVPAGQLQAQHLLLPINALLPQPIVQEPAA